MLLFVFLASIGASLAADAQYCYQCATPGLQNKWQLTGLPKFPTDLQFVTSCLTLTNVQTYDDALAAKIVAPTCSTSCFSVALPSANGYEMVRGCHANFVDPTNTEQSVGSGAKNCSFSNVNIKYMYTAPNGNVSPRDSFSAVQFCPVDSTMTETHACNGMNPTTWSPSVITAIPECAEVQNTNCYDCGKYDGKGNCDPKKAAKRPGPVCTKIQGKVNGHDYVERSPSFIPPYKSANLCVWIRQNTTYSTGMGFGRTVTRTKRDIDQVFEGFQCFCRGDSCNSSPVLFPLAAFIGALVTVLPFF